MSAAGGGSSPLWTRRVPGSSVLLFVLLSGGLWAATLLSWEARQPELVVLLLAGGAFVPVLWLGVRLRDRPLWALHVPWAEGLVRAAVRDAIRERALREISMDQAGREGLFRACDVVLEIEEPACLMGVQGSREGPSTTLLLLPRSRDRKAIRGLLDAIAGRLGSM